MSKKSLKKSSDVESAKRISRKKVSSRIIFRANSTRKKRLKSMHFVKSSS